MKIPKRTEHEEQTIVMAWTTVASEMQSDSMKRLALRWVHSIPNGFYKSPAARMKAKREGVKAGILDLFVPAPELRVGVRSGKAIYNGLAIEMKRRGEKLRSGQSDYMDYLDLVRYRNALCFSWQCAARLIAEHLDLKPGTYPPIEGEGEDDREIASRILAEAKEIDLRLNPPKPKEPDRPKRKARPRGSKAK